MIKTYENWQGGLSEYLQVGDLVDEGIVDHFLNVMPPACWTANIIQIGEAADHINGRAVYYTLVRTDNGWAYAGTCHRGETSQPQ